MTDLLSPPQFPFSQELTYVLDATGKGFLETQRWELPQNVDTSHLSDISDLQYVVGAVIYHCRRLAEAYSDICFHSIKLFPPSPESTVFNSSNNCEACYEFDALVTAARRIGVYMSWLAVFYGLRRRKGERPGNFEKILKTLKEDLPSDLADRLNTNWSQFGEKLREYRPKRGGPQRLQAYADDWF